MTTDEKLTAILAAVQTDPGNRGLARDPHDNLFTATKGDFEAACRSIAEYEETPVLSLHTGFFIPTGTPPAYETDGPLGCAFLMRALLPLDCQIATIAPRPVGKAIAKVMRAAKLRPKQVDLYEEVPSAEPPLIVEVRKGEWLLTTHQVAVEHVGRATDGRYYSMRGRDITEHTYPHDDDFLMDKTVCPDYTIGIGYGGNEIGMGKIPHETIVKNIPNGDLIHCRVPTDHLIVAGVSNWGAYALDAGIYVLRGVKPPPDLFDPDREREILEVMVREGPLVDGVTGQQTATVDGLTCDEYAKPLVRIREILET